MVITADRWARACAMQGINVLWPTLAVYDFGLYPSRYNVTCTTPATFDLARVILLTAEKYGMGAVFDFKPRARELTWVDETEAGGYYLMNNRGEIQTPDKRHKFNPLHPRNRQCCLGMLGEFADRYKDSPAFGGVSLRLSPWQNPSLNNFHSLDWGYDDFTAALFEKETGVKTPSEGNDPQRFYKRW